METHDEQPSPDREQARAALSAAGQAETIVRYPAMPAWFFPAMTALIAALPLTQLLDGTTRTRAMLVIAAAALGLNVLAQRQVGIAWSTYTFNDSLPMLAAFAVTAVTAVVIVAVTDQSWVWIATAVVAGAIVAFTGWRYQRFAKRARA